MLDCWRMSTSKIFSRDNLLALRARLRAALAAVEELEKPANDLLLARNHALALEVDDMSRTAAAQVIANLRRTRDDRVLTDQLLRETTGYRDGFSRQRP